ncbi:MAG: alpha-amylase family glycosyl hydrolase [Alphaproteobacteria bacterium]
MNHNWWDSAVIYQIYPRSFRDSNGDGIGDLPGITEKLESVADLGVDCLWLSPFFKSPFKDFGYDVSDYRAVDPVFGSDQDFDELLNKAHGLGMKVIIDQVLCHCSAEHKWFEESRQDRTNPKADWFVWHDPKPDGTEPNNWLSFFGGRAWTWDARRRQYYFHNFLTSQPNLNHRNPEVRAAVIAECKYWLDKGVDGFRLDAIHTMAFDPDFRDNDPRTDLASGGDDSRISQPFGMQFIQSKQIDQPWVNTFLSELRTLADSYDQPRFLMGELGGDNGMDMINRYTQPGLLHSCYNFDLLAWDGQTAEELEGVLRLVTDKLEGHQITFATSNHDVPRVSSRQVKRLGLQPEDTDRVSMMMIELEMALHGSVCMYMGEELGLEDADRLAFEDLQDPWGIEFWPTFIGRDTCRTPIPWDRTEKNAGFSSADRPWLPVDERHLERGMNQQISDPDSFRSKVKNLIGKRKAGEIITGGDLEVVESPENMLVLARKSGNKKQRVMFNFGTKAASFDGIEVEGLSSVFTQPMPD